MRKQTAIMMHIIFIVFLCFGCTNPSPKDEKKPDLKAAVDNHATVDVNNVAEMVTPLPQICGNNILEPGEACDGTILGTCLSCSASCLCAPLPVASFGADGTHHLMEIDECVEPKIGECEIHGCNIFKVASSSGIDISVTEWGNKQGPPILFIHGFPWSYVTWLDQLTAQKLAHKFHLFTMDLRGFGLSDKPNGENDYQASELWAADVKSVIDAVSNGEPIIVVGHSYGALAISDYVSVYGDSALAGIVFVGGFIPSRVDDMVDLFLVRCFPLLFPGLFANDIEKNVYNMQAFVELSSNLPVPQNLKDLHFGSGMMSTSFSREHTITRDFLVLPSPVISYNDVLNSITKPVLLIHGENDRVVERRASDHYQDELINSVCVTKIIFDENVGHTPHLEEPNRFNRLIFNFASDPVGFCD